VGHRHQSGGGCRSGYHHRYDGYVMQSIGVKFSKLAQR
jgi:hypothetical protein